MHQTLKNAGLMTATVVLGLAASEAALRVAGISYPQWYVEDADLGGALRPGARGRFDREGNAWVEINSAGMRDREHTVAKPPGVFRIAVLGDSFAEAMQVDRERAFWAVLERRLRGCAWLGGREPEVLNFGVSGYGTAQELIALRTRVWQFDPDLVLLAFFTGNDIRNNSRALNGEAGVPYFVLKDGALVEDESFRERLASANAGGPGLSIRSMLASARNHLRLLQLATQARVALGHYGAALPEARAAEKREVTGEEPGVDSEIYAPPRDDRWRDAWNVTEALITTMRDEVRARGRQFWLVTLSTGIQVHPDPAVRRAFAERRGIQDLFYPDRRLASLASREGIPTVTLAPEMSAWAETNGVYLHGFPNAAEGFGHWNEAGNALAGELIAARICGAALLPASRITSHHR